MAKGISLHIGVNTVNPEHYGYTFPLQWSAHDALAMQQIAKETGYETHCLLNEEATTENFYRVMAKAKKELEPGDIFFLSFSGHGAQCPDYNFDEDDRYDEAWVLYDRMLLDDEGVVCWLDFSNHIRIAIVTDCCYSGLFSDTVKRKEPVVIDEKKGLRSLSPYYAGKIMRRNWTVYDAPATKMEMHERGEIVAPSLQLSACGINEGAMEYSLYQHGAFTHALLEAWEEGRFNEYGDFYKRIVEKMPLAGQTPGLSSWGANCAQFLKQRPFEI